MKLDKKDLPPGSSDHWFRILLLLLSVSFILTTAVVVSGVTDDWDRDVTRTFSEALGPTGTTVFRFFTLLGNHMVLGPATAAAVIVSFIKGYRKRALLFPSMMLSSVPLYWGMKRLIQRSRPDFALMDVAGYSYPSGHATVSFTFFLGLYVLFFYPKKRCSFTLLASFVVPPALIGLSRVFLAVHYPTDIIGGSFLGGALTTAFYLLYGSLPWDSKGGRADEHPLDSPSDD